MCRVAVGVFCQVPASRENRFRPEHETSCPSALHCVLNMSNFLEVIPPGEITLRILLDILVEYKMPGRSSGAARSSSRSSSRSSRPSSPSWTPAPPSVSRVFQTSAAPTPILFASIKEGFGWGVGTSLGRNLVDSVFRSSSSSVPLSATPQQSLQQPQHSASLSQPQSTPYQQCLERTENDKAACEHLQEAKKTS